jgi:hypothetical protein
MNRVNNYGIRVKTVTTYEEFKTLYMELFNTMFSYKPIVSQLRGRTSDMGYLGAFPVEMHLGNSLRYVAIIDSINVNHVIFTDQMVPIFSTVSISAKRVPDYQGGAVTDGS